MSIPQGSTFNTAFFDDQITRLKSCGSCEDLQAALAEVTGSITNLQTAIASELQKLQPILALIQPPAANPAEIVTWITNFIEGYLTPYTVPTVTYPLQLAQLAEQVSKIQAAASEAASKFPNCSV